MYHEMSHQEIADVLGSSVGAVKANFFHALGNLKKLLGDRGSVMRHLTTGATRRSRRRRRDGAVDCRICGRARLPRQLAELRGDDVRGRRGR